MSFFITQDQIEAANRESASAHEDDFASLGRQLERRGVHIEQIVAAVMSFAVAVPTWGVGTGGTRFARFPGPGEPRNIFDKLEDCGVIHRLTRATPTVSPHIPWDVVSDYAELKEKAAAVMSFAVAVPTWGVGTGGTRFARFPGPGEPRNIFDKLEDCGVIHRLTRATPTVSPHFPWDVVSDYAELKEKAAAQGLGFDAVNSNTFQDQPGQTHSYKFGSLSNNDEATRQQAVKHNIECIEIGRKLGSKALTVWVGDGSNFAGQSNLTRALDNYLEAMSQVYMALPADWNVYIEHKLYEPAFYSTVISDWGTSFAAAMELGPKAKCLVDLGHHAPNVNIEQIVARLVRFGKLAGFHFNDSKYGDDDLDAGSVDPFRLFLVFNELVDAAHRRAPGFAPAYMIDQSHNVTDPIESLMSSAMELTRAYAQALLIHRGELATLQEKNDALAAHRLVKRAFVTDVTPILAEARRRAGGALHPFALYRASGYRAAKTRERPASGVAAAGIV